MLVFNASRSDDVPADVESRELVAPLTGEIEQLSRAWGVVGHLHSVNDIPEWREGLQRMLPEVSRFFAELGQNLKLFARYKAMRESAEYATLDAGATAQDRHDNGSRDFRLSGAELPEEQKPRFQAISEELASLSAKFSGKLLDATMPSPSSLPTRPEARRHRR